MKRQLVNLAKLGFAGATIFGIAWTITVQDTDGDVQEAQADIATYTTTEALLGGSFGKTMEASGMKPRPYEMNGNQVFFAVEYVKQDPEEVLDYYQEQFVAAGINERKFTEVPEAKFHRSIQDLTNPKGQKMSEEEVEYNEALLTGGVVPLTQRDGYVAMGGMVPRESHARVNELVEDWASNDSRNLFRQMDGFRFIDAQQWPGQIGSRVTSVWADSDFDAEKMAQPQKNAGPPVLETPICLGCNVGMQMRSLDKSERFRIGHFYSNRQKDDLLSFYRTAMKNRGYDSGQAQTAIGLARQYLGPGEIPSGAIMTYQRNGTEAMIAVFDDHSLDETSVMVVETF